MKAAKLLGVIERRASAQITRLLNAAWKHYGRLSQSAAKVTSVDQQRRYIRAVQQTITSAEKIIAQLKVRVAAVEKSLAARKKRPVKRAKRRAKPQVKRAATRAKRKKCG